jgi:hypothetical protein
MIYFITTAGYTKVEYSKSLALIKGRLRAQYPPDAVLQFVGEGGRWAEGNAHHLLREAYVEREWFRGELTQRECAVIHDEAFRMGDVGLRTFGQSTKEQKRVAGLRSQAVLTDEQRRAFHAAGGHAHKGRVSPMKGRAPWNKGLVTPEAVRLKISESRRKPTVPS